MPIRKFTQGEITDVGRADEAADEAADNAQSDAGDDVPESDGSGESVGDETRRPQ